MYTAVDASSYGNDFWQTVWTHTDWQAGLANLILLVVCIVWLLRVRDR